MLIIKTTVVILLLLVSFQVNFAQTQEEWDWVNKNFSVVLKELMPIEKFPNYSIAYRSYRDLYTEEVETSFVISKNWRSGQITAVLKKAEGKSIYDQIMYWHQKNANESIESIKKKIKVATINFTDLNCVKIKPQFTKFYSMYLPQFSDKEKSSKTYKEGAINEIEIVLHPKIYEINADFTSAKLNIVSPDSENPFVVWGTETIQILN